MLLMWDKWKSSHPGPTTNENVDVNPTPSMVPTLPSLGRGAEDNLSEGQNTLKRTREDANDNETTLPSLGNVHLVMVM